MMRFASLAATLSAFLVAPAGASAAITISGTIWYDPRGIDPDKADTGVGSPQGDWSNSNVDTANVTNALPWVNVEVWERDGNCIDYTNDWTGETCNEVDDDFVTHALSGYDGYFNTGALSPSTTDESGDWEIYLLTKYRGGSSVGNFAVRVSRNIDTLQGSYKLVHSPEIVVSTSQQTLTRHWNMTCPDHINAWANQVDCDDGGTNPEDYFEPSKGYTGWYALTLRDLTSLFSTGAADYFPPNVGDCSSGPYQQTIRLVLLMDDAGPDPEVYGDGPDATLCTVQKELEADLMCTDPGPIESGGWHTDLDWAPETYHAFEMAHPLGHLLFMRYLCICKEGTCTTTPRDDDLCDRPPGVGATQWRTIYNERAAFCEGWAEFVQVAALWPRNTNAADGAMTPQNSYADQVEFIDPTAAGEVGGATGAQVRDCACDDHPECDSSCVAGFPNCNNPQQPQTSMANVTAFLWDAYDTRNDDRGVAGCGNAQNGCDNDDATFQQMLDVLWNYGDAGASACGTDNADFEDGVDDFDACDANQQGVTGNEFPRSRNVWDFSWVSPDDLTSEGWQNCVNASDAS